MSDLYYETADAGATDSGTSPEPARDAATPEQERAETDSYSEYRETEAETEARIADQDELPDPAESRAATWGDNPEYYDETELSAENGGDSGAFPSEDDDTPTPQESRAQTWGDNPDYHDETDLASAHESDPDAATTEHDDPVQHAQSRPDTTDNLAESAAEPQDAPDELTQRPDADHHDQDAATATDDHLDPADTGTVTAEPQAPDADTIADTATTDTQRDEPDNAEPPGGSADEPPSPEAEQLKALEAEHTDTKQELARTKDEVAELRATVADLQAKDAERDAEIDGIKKMLASPDRQPDRTDAPEHTDDKSASPLDRQKAQDASIAEHEGNRSVSDTRDVSRRRLRDAVSSENLGIGAQVFTAGTVVEAFGSKPTAETLALGLGAVGFGLAQAGRARYDKWKEKRKT